MSWTRGPLRTPGLDSMELCPLVSLDNVPLIRLSSDLPEFHDFTIQSKRIGGTGDVEMKERLLIGLNNASATKTVFAEARFHFYLALYYDNRRPPENMFDSVKSLNMKPVSTSQSFC